MARKPDVPCASCGRLMWRGSSSLPPGIATCHPCRREQPKPRKPLPPIDCPMCGNEFIPGSRKTRTCSLSCGQRLRNAEGRGRWSGTTVEQSHERKRERYRRKNRKRRAALRGTLSEPYSLREIAERDGFACGLCGDPLDMAVDYPDRECPSIDHVLPLSVGGTDTRENVQLAHLSCNVAKGARVDGGHVDGALSAA